MRAALAWRALGLALFLAYPVAAHYAVVSDRPAVAVALLAALAVYVAASFLLAPHPARWLLPPAAAALMLFSVWDVSWVLYLPPLALNLGLCWLFGRTLRRGREPLIARFAVMEQASLSAELSAYTRVLTWLWTAFFAAAALVSLWLALSGNRDAWSLFTNFLNYALVAVLFLGEFVYRRLRYRSYRHLSPLKLLRNVRRADLLER